MKNGELKVEKGIPIPDYRHGRTESPFTQTLKAMKVGDSFLDHRPVVRVSNALVSYRSYHGGKEKFTVRTVEGGTRVWRIK